jgi:hypothetical protein
MGQNFLKKLLNYKKKKGADNIFSNKKNINCIGVNPIDLMSVKIIWTSRKNNNKNKYL